MKAHDIEELQVALKQAQRQRAIALADDDTPAAAKALKTLADAQQALEDAMVVQDVMREREAATEATRKAEVTAELHSRVGVHAGQSLPRAKRAVELAVELGGEIAALIIDRREIGILSPDKLSEECAISHDRVIGSFITEMLQRNGVLATLVKQPIGLSAWELEKNPTLVERITAANDYLATFSKGA
jgi:hypothetical protein